MPALLLPILFLLAWLPLSVQAEAIPAPDTMTPGFGVAIAHPRDPKVIKAASKPIDFDEAWKQEEEAGPKIILPMLAQFHVSMEKVTLGGVPCFLYTPENLAPEDAHRIALHLHGGAYTEFPGILGSGEGLIFAGRGRMKVLSVDYRLAPKHPYPAAIDDMMAVYKALLTTYPAQNIAVFGSSTGGGMTLILPLRARAEGLPFPGALGAGTPWSDLSKRGDSYWTNEGIDTTLVTYGSLAQSVEAYAAGQDLHNPFLSPVYGDMSDFPPTMLTSGTRDLFLSNTVRVHRKLLQAGRHAELIVWEGQSHVQYCTPQDIPEVREHFTWLADFFRRYLGSSPK